MSTPFHYLPEEVALPSGASVEDLNWTVFSWTVSARWDSNGGVMVQFVLAPGILLIRSESESKMFEFIKQVKRRWNMEQFQRSNPSDNLMEMARRITNEELESPNAKIEHKPFMLTLNPEDHPYWKRPSEAVDEHGNPNPWMVKTLGEALDVSRLGSEVVECDVYNLVLEEYHRHVKEALL